MGAKRAANGRNAVIFAVTSAVAYLLGLRRGYTEVKSNRRMIRRLRRALEHAEQRNADLMALAQENSQDDQTE